MFQAKRSGWKRLATSLLLLPGLSAVGAEMLHVLGTARADERPAAARPVKAATATKLMQQARAAFDRGDYATAAELAETARDAEGASPYGGDSPDRLLAEIEKKTAGRQPARPTSASEEMPARTKGQADEPRPRTRATTDNPKVLVKKAREALDAGRLDLAQDLARQAESHARGVSWGLFEETPASLLKDIQKARGKRDRAEADKLLNQARALYEKRTPGDELRAANLDRARSMCLHAAQLHGPYSMWDFGDRPESLIKDIDSARAKIKVAARRTNPVLDENRPSQMGVAKKTNRHEPMGDSSSPYGGAVAKKAPPATPPITEPVGDPASPYGGAVAKKAMPTPPGPVGDPDPNQGGYNPIRMNPGPVVSRPFGGGVKTVANNERPGLILPPSDDPPEASEPAGPANARKAQAVQQMKQALVLQRDGKYVEARKVLSDAQKLNAGFAPDEESPDVALQALMADAQKHINTLCRQAHAQMVKKTTADVAEADRKLTEADAIAAGLGLDRWEINGHRSILTAIMSNRPAGGSPDTPPAVADVKPPADRPPVATGMKDPAEIPEAIVLPPDMTPVVKAPDQGTELLRQAHNEMKAKAFDSARKIATQVLNGPFACKDQAQDLLRTIDAEELTQRQHTAARSYEQGVNALRMGNHRQAVSIFKLIDPTLLPEGKRAELNRHVAAATKALDKSAVAQAAGPRDPDLPAPAEKNGADNLLKQQEAMLELQFQKLRAEGLQVESSATARFGKGETDSALAELNGFVAKVKSSGLEPAKVALLTRPIESRVERLKVLKHQQDFLTKEAKDLRNFRNQMTQDALHTAHKKEEVARLMKDFHKLVDEAKFQEAYKTAMVARELDPEDPATLTAMKMAQMMYRKETFNKSRADTEEWNWKIGQENLDLGHPVTSKDPVIFDKDHFNQIRNRQDSSAGMTLTRPRTDKEKQIESKLNTQTISLNFKNTPLDEVVAYFATYSGLNFDIDTRALRESPTGPVDPKEPITCTLNNITIKSALGVVLDKLNLRYVVTKEVVRITTPKGARGEMQRRTVPVADLVIPVQNYAPSAISNLDNVLTHGMQNSRAMLPGSATTPYTPLMGLGTGMGTPTGAPSLGGPRPGGTLLSTPSGSGSGWTKEAATGTIEEALIRLITSSVQPDTWEAMGGPGHIEYYPLGMALVINQTPDVIEEVLRLLEALRALQDLEIAIEVRMITLAETFYERIGLDFSMNLDTHNSKAVANLLNNPGNSTLNFNNIRNAGGKKIIGLQVPGVPTPDLDIPINATSFPMAIPPFGNFPNAPGADGGISLGLAFLSDIQVQMFLEAAQGDRRTNVMQAPKLTMFNGQSANILIQDQQFFLTGIQVTSVNGQLVFTPQNNPFPLGVSMFMQPVVSGDRRFVRLNIQQSMTNLASATVPLFPITTIVTPVFEGGSQGQPVPFTQFIQQPTFSTITVRTTVVVPDGGTVLLGGLKTLSEGRNEFGPPVLSKIPYVNRLFRNVGYGREAQSLMMMVTPRIIINREEQERQTGVIENQGR